jgi:hypothetical protein
VEAFTSWSDGSTLIDLVVSLRNDEYDGLEIAEELAAILEETTGALLDGTVFPDDLDTICDAIDRHRDDFGMDVVSAMHRAIIREIDDAMETASGYDSESVLEDHAKILKKLGNRIGVAEETIERAVSSIEERIAELDESSSTASAPELSSVPVKTADQFDDIALRDLFMPLFSNP